MKTQIEDWITAFVLAYPREKKVVTRWREPLVGVASARDTFFVQMKKIAQPNHVLPADLLEDAKSVVVYYVPFSVSLHRENFRAGYHCSRSWAVAYLETNRLISDINQFMKERLESGGSRVALIPPTHNFDQDTLMSDWSHRHVAYLAGLGGFGRHNLLITEKGCTGRIGSFVTDLHLEPSPAAQKEACLSKAGFDCLKCVRRCEYGALSPDGYDRYSCYDQCLKNDRFHDDLDLTDVCGKCSVMVPCSLVDPVKKARRLRDREN